MYNQGEKKQSEIPNSEFYQNNQITTCQKKSLSDILWEMEILIFFFFLISFSAKSYLLNHTKVASTYIWSQPTGFISCKCTNIHFIDNKILLQKRKKNVFNIVIRYITINNTYKTSSNINLLNDNLILAMCTWKPH